MELINKRVLKRKKSLNEVNLWQFSKITCMEEFAFNKVLERFYNFGVVGLVRENIQNSLDGKIPGSNEPVIVKIETGSINKKEIPGLDEIKNRIKCLKWKNDYTKETIEHMKAKMDLDDVNYISFEDSNTKGLSGAQRGQEDNPKNTWSIYAYNKGVHGQDDDRELEKSRGGSHGIGKIASNAASDLYLMYFANCDEYDHKHLGGTIQLIEHEYKNNYYRATGYFTSVENLSDSKTKFIPHENKFNKVFSKDTRGLKIIIPFLREQFNDEDAIIKSVCDSFFIAILDKKLEVWVNDKVINSKNVAKFISNKKYYEQEIENIKHEFTKLYFDTYTKEKPQVIKIKDRSEFYEFDLYFKYDERIQTGRLGIIRTIGMKIEDKKIKNNVKKPFNGVLIPKSLREDEFLKSLENESHTELSYEHIKDQKIQKNAKTFINNISKELSNIIEQEIRKNNPTDGAMDTQDILYEVTSSFKRDLEKTMPTVKITKDSKSPVKEKEDKATNGNNKPLKKEITIIKDFGGLDKDDPINPETKENGTADKGDGNKRKEKTKKKRKPKPKVVSKDLEGENRENKIIYTAPVNIVERVVTSTKEYLMFDFKEVEEFKRLKTCGISFVLVDGMGEEYTEGFDMSKNYKSITDLNSETKLTIDKNSISNIKVKNHQISLELELDSSYNRAHKFVYYVEV